MHPSTQPIPGEPTRVADDRGRPRPRDLIVFRDARSSIRHAVAEYPGDAQFSAASRAEALRLASGYARAHRLDVWYRESHRYERIESFRPKPDGAD